MASLAAIRTGAGYVTLGAPGSLEATFTARPVETMMRGLPDEDGGLTEAAVEPALEATGRADAVVLGPGLGRTDGARAFARTLFERVEVPLVVDADGLNALAGAEFPERPGPAVLTPHAGELGRLLDVESAEVGRRRLFHAREAAARSGAIVVLKGDDTLVVDPAGRVAISPGRAPALATAGTGDVLSGVLGAMLAKRMDPFHAACAAVYAHLRAGQLAAEPHGPDGVIASDVIARLPAALNA
jgi:ADP-dependent NAD(P)H-hydrate dehydratase / NAD(P)H-hydrate epimerase